MSEPADCNYPLISKNGNQYIRSVNNTKNKDVDELMVSKDKGWLYISMPAGDGTATILIFERTAK